MSCTPAPQTTDRLPKDTFFYHVVEAVLTQNATVAVHTEIAAHHGGQEQARIVNVRDKASVCQCEEFEVRNS